MSHRFSSSSCRPISCTWPRSRTMIASAETRDDKRCETTIRVRPCAILEILAVTIASLSASSELVASSRIKIRGLMMSARAMAKSLPLSARQVRRALIHESVVTARQLIDEFLGASETRGTHDFIEGRIGLGRHDVVADRTAEQEILLQHHAKAVPKVINIVFAHINAVDLDQPFVIGVQALQQPSNRRLPRSASAHNP